MFWEETSAASCFINCPEQSAFYRQQHGARGVHVQEHIYKRVVIFAFPPHPQLADDAPLQRSSLHYCRLADPPLSLTDTPRHPSQATWVWRLSSESTPHHHHHPPREEFLARQWLTSGVPVDRGLIKRVFDWKELVPFSSMHFSIRAQWLYGPRYYLFKLYPGR